MNIIIIVNIIAALSIMLGGICMKKYADDPADYSIGFRTSRAMASSKAWSFANKKCGIAWGIIGAVCFALTLTAVFLLSDYSFIQPAILFALVSAAVISAALVEIQLKKLPDDNTPDK